METVCVIGCSGFVGSHVTAELLSRGYRVHGTLRDAGEANTAWLRERVAPHAADGASLHLFAADAFDKSALRTAMEGCGGVIVCAGSPKLEPETIELMTALADNVCDLALDLGIPVAVFTSSTGSTNPAEGEPKLKNEELHWSDPELQREQGKLAAVGKTLLDRTVLQKMADSEGRLRTVTINPSMILGPAFQDEPVTSLKGFAAIIKGERMGDKVPNGSMSMIDVRDLAKLHVAALENPEAKGRYFGVKKSWHWRDILAALERHAPGYRMPPVDQGEKPVRPTTFDLSRQASLGVELRDIDAILADAVGELQRRGMV